MLRNRRCLLKKNLCSVGAFTLLEVIVCLGIIAVVFSMLLVGVMSVRETSRRNVCQNNLRQNVIGLLQFTDRDGRLPGMTSNGVFTPSQSEFAAGPFIAIAHQLSIPMRVERDEILFSDERIAEPIAPSVFTCPSNGDRKLGFRLNIGVRPIYKRGERLNSLYRQDSSNRLRLSGVIDGLSNTAALAERPMQTDSMVLQRAVANSNLFAPATESDIENGCDWSYAQGWLFVSVAGGGWSWWSYAYETTYTHTKRPNSARVDCMCSVTEDGPWDTVVHYNVGSRSYHAGGVNCAFLDGSVRFISNDIDLSIWNAFGTHDGRD